MRTGARRLRAAGRYRDGHHAQPGFSTVNRENGLRVVSVTGDIDESDPARADEITRAIDEEILPRIAEDFGIDYRISGLAEQEDARSSPMRGSG